MALLTQKAILSTFEEMLEEMPFDKITVSALVKRCGVSSNTFYYHYQDIYALLDVWLNNTIGRIRQENVDEMDWKKETKAVLLACQRHPKIISHIITCLSREQLERYLFVQTDDAFVRHVKRKTAGKNLTDKQQKEIAQFCRYSFLGFFLKFSWDHMQADVDESVDLLGILFDCFVDSASDTFQKQNL